MVKLDLYFHALSDLGLSPNRPTPFNRLFFRPVRAQAAERDNIKILPVKEPVLLGKL